MDLSDYSIRYIINVCANVTLYIIKYTSVLIFSYLWIVRLALATKTWMSKKYDNNIVRQYCKIAFYMRNR